MIRFFTELTHTERHELNERDISLSSPKGGEGRGEEAKLFSIESRTLSDQIPSPRLGGAREFATHTAHVRGYVSALRFFAMLICFPILLARANDVADKLTTAGIVEFTAAYQAWEGAGFAKAAELFRQASTNTSATATNFYWLGAAQFHRLLQLQNSPGASTNKEAAATALDAAMEALLTAVKLDEKHAESHALLGTLYGMKIGDSVLRGAWFGPRVVKHRDLAVALGADNPRVRYLFGMCQFHTASKPAAWQKTLTTLLAAEKLFETEAKCANAPLEPRWGYSSCLTFIGLTCELLGERAKAAEYFRKALAEHPADHLAKAGLGRVETNNQK